MPTPSKSSKSLGILTWVRRCREEWINGRYVRTQEKNAYAILPPEEWLFNSMTDEPPPPEPGTWGAHPPLPSQIEQAVSDRHEGGDMRTVIQTLGCDAGDLLAAALASLGMTMLAKANPQ